MSGVLIKMFSIIKALISITRLNISLCSSFLGDYHETRVKHTHNLIGGYVTEGKKFEKASSATSAKIAM